MLQYLLTLGYSPVAAPTRCFPPHMTAIALCDSPNLGAYDILAQNSKADLNLRTSIFSIHVLHFAATRLDIPLLQYLINNPNTPLEASGTTALSSTLLHISTLPLTDAHINIFSRKKFHSILDTKHWVLIDFNLRNPQQEMVLRTQAGTKNVGSQDVYGNTPLHYLSAMWVNDELLGEVEELPEHTRLFARRSWWKMVIRWRGNNGRHFEWKVIPPEIILRVLLTVAIIFISSSIIIQLISYLSANVSSSSSANISYTAFYFTGIIVFGRPFM